MTLVERVPIQPQDALVALGDYVDRGPRSREVLDWLVERSRGGKLVALRGNHELMMLLARDEPTHVYDWLQMGGRETLASYAATMPGDAAAEGEKAFPKGIPQEHWWFVEDFCRDYHETDTHFFVHANASADLLLEEQPDYMLFWEKFHNPPAPHRSGKIMVCGHTPQKSGHPQHIGHAICIDTWAYGEGWLTCLDVGSGQYWQANEAGAFREAHLEKPAARS